MKQHFIFAIGGLALLSAIGILVWRHDKIVDTLPLSELTDTRLTVAATFYPLAYLAEQVGGDNVNVVSVTPAGVEPHDFEPSPRDLIKIGQADLVLINGAGLDLWAEKASTDWVKKGQRVLVMSESVELLAAPTDTDDHSEAAEADHAQGGYDPHFWLDPIRARQMVGAIRDQLIAADPANTDIYNQNAITASEKLGVLDTDFRLGLAKCAQREIVAAHDAYNYLVNRYNLKLYSIAGLSPESEPSARHLAELSDLVKSKKITTIFFESLTSPKLADTLARETGAKTAVLNPIEGLTLTEIAAGKNYDILMRENLAELRSALVCL